MGRLHQRHLLVAISGGIAAYKGAELVRLLKKQGAAVRVVLSRGATEFITPLTMQALSGEPTHTELLDEEAEAGMGHIELARWADLMIVAPATADVIARLAQGRADDLLTTVALATPAPVAVAPAMNQQMWAHAATQNNVELLASRGIQIIGPEAGEQACGDVGPGRLLEPEAIVATLSERFENRSLAGRRVVITAGPTREAIDPVRYLSNHSSGKMGYALAQAFAAAGAQVELISGPVALTPPERVDVHRVTSAVEMCATRRQSWLVMRTFLLARRRSQTIARQKRQAGKSRNKTGAGSALILSRIRILSRQLRNCQTAHESSQGLPQRPRTCSATREPRVRKGLDMIIANDVGAPETTFGSDQNAVHLITAESETRLTLASKYVIAEHIVAALATQLSD